jgi:hypothetical protein
LALDFSVRFVSFSNFFRFLRFIFKPCYFFSENRIPTKNPKTQTIKDVRLSRTENYPPNEKADQAAKEALHEDIATTETYPPDDLKKWLFEEDFNKRDHKWKNGNNERKDAGRRQKRGYEKNAKEIASGNIQTQNRVYEGHPRPQHGRGQQFTMTLLQHLSTRRPHTVGMQRN